MADAYSSKDILPDVGPIQCYLNPDSAIVLIVKNDEEGADVPFFIMTPAEAAKLSADLKQLLAEHVKELAVAVKAL